MKKILVVLVAFLLLATPLYALNIKQIMNNSATGSSADKESVTTEVYNAGTVAISQGKVVTWESATYDDGRCVTMTSRLGQKVAGVAAEDIAASGWGTIIVYGYCSKVFTSQGNAITVGMPLYANGSDVTADNSIMSWIGCAGGLTSYNAITQSYVKAAYAPYMVPFGYAIDTAIATSTNGTCEFEAIIDCL